MIKRFVALEWKEFFRASYFQKGLVIKILLVLATLYFSAIAIFMGIGMYFIFEKLIEGVDPNISVNNYLIYWFLVNIIMRYFLQQLPVMNIKPFMIIPIKRNVVIHYLLGKTAISFFNFLSLFIFLPYAIVLLNKGYEPLNVSMWLLSVMFITYSINYMNFLINKSNKYFYAMVPLLLGAVGLEVYDIFKVSEVFGTVFNGMYNNAYTVLITLAIMLLFYVLAFRNIRGGFYLDASVKEKAEKIRATNLSFLDRFGSMSVFLKNDVKLIMRNARPKQVMLMSFLFLFYGLIFYTQDIYLEQPWVLAFASMFVTGGFLMTFGQMVPSWDSEYYKMLMSQNIPYRQYLNSKWYLMLVATVISFILSTPYIYFGWDIFGMIAAGALFNIGLNTFITLFGGALNRVPVELNVKAKAFSNTQGFNPTQLLIALPKIVLPMLLFYLPYIFISFEAGLWVLAGSGVVGILFKNVFLNFIESIYQKGKYKTIAAFGEKK
ncbi:DUF5687 family protein [Urechidicola sp. KH5]